MVHWKLTSLFVCLAYKGTSATTTITTQTGDDTVFISSEANQNTENARSVDVLLGWLDYIEQDLTVDVSIGRHRLLMSDEKSLIAKGEGESGPAVLTNRSLTNLRTNLGDIFFETDGNWSAGVNLWLGKGDDNLNVESVPSNAGSPPFRTVTSVHAGDGDDTLVISLETADHDGVVFVANGQAGNDNIDASMSSHPVILFGERGNDILKGGQGSDVILGDLGNVIWREAVATPEEQPERRLSATRFHSHADLFQHHYSAKRSQGDIVARVGGGGYGDFSDGIIRTISEVRSLYVEVGGLDVIDTGDGENLAVGGFNNDIIQGGSDNDILVRFCMDWASRSLKGILVCNLNLCRSLHPTGR